LLVGHNLLVSVHIQLVSLLHGNVAFKPLCQDNLNDCCRKYTDSKNLNILSHPPVHLQAHAEL